MTTPLTPYQKRLFVFLSVATFFEGYDFFALTQILPNLRADFGLSKFDAGLLFAFVNFGTVVAWLLVRRADRWGRRRVLTITIVGYTVFTLLSGLSWNAVSFAIFQFVARIFLIGEWATSMVYAAEEYPADRRGTMIGVLQAFASLGGIVCAGVAPMLLATEYGWRSVYFVGVIPLAILAFARRGLRETARFEAIAARGESLVRPIFAIWKTPYRRRLIQLATIWFLTYACTQIAVSFWKDFAVTERGLTDADVGRALVVASLVSMPFVFLAGKLLDVVGRKRGSILIFTLTSVGVFFAYTLHGSWPLTIAMALSVFGISAVLPALNAFTTELFPTELRGDAFAWSNNLLGRTGYVLSPIAIGWAAETWSWGAAIRPTALLPLVALALIYLWLPETRHRELEETAAL
jgi:putative MFS transporter